MDRISDIPLELTSSETTHIIMRSILVIAEQRNRCGRDALAGIDEVAREDGWHLTLATSVGDRTDGRTDGVIGYLSPDDPRLARLRAAGVPVVSLDADIPIDQQEVGRCAAHHLLERGIERTATVTFAGINPHFQDRVAGFSLSSSLDAGQHILQDLPWRSQFDRFAPWLLALPQPIGIFAPNDHIAGIVLKGCQELSLPVPSGIAVVGADNDLGVCLTASIPISSVRMPHLLQGKEGACRLRRLLAGEVVEAHLPLKPSAVCTRASSDTMTYLDEVSAKALAWIRRHYAHPFRIDTLARDIGINRRTLERRFRQVLGRSILDELNRMRIHRAQELLSHEDGLPISAIATAVGLSTSAFSSAFLRTTGTAPGNWRTHRTRPAAITVH